MEKIKILGVANLPEADRERVCFYIMFSNWEIFFGQCIYADLKPDLFFFFFLGFQYNTILSTMENIYSTAKVYPEPNISWSLEPGE